MGGKGSRGWQVLDFKMLKTPPEWLASGVYVLAVLLLAYVVYMITLGLIAFTSLGHQIVSGAAATQLNPQGGASLTTFFTVLLALVGGPLVIWRVITAHVQAQAARHQAETAREGHYTDLFTKAVEQLGATREVTRFIDGGIGKVTETQPNLEVRLGAIYALERVAHDSERDHWPIMEVLCAYIRNPQNSGDPKKVWRPRVDVQAALTVIGRRPPLRVAYEISQKVSLDLSGANLQGANLVSGNFANTLFVGAFLNQAFLLFADLKRAVVRSAHLSDAIFYGADLHGTDFSDSEGLAETTFFESRGDACTVLPPDVKRPAHWPPPRS